MSRLVLAGVAAAAAAAGDADKLKILTQHSRQLFASRRGRGGWKYPPLPATQASAPPSSAEEGESETGRGGERLRGVCVCVSVKS